MGLKVKSNLSLLFQGGIPSAECYNVLTQLSISPNCIPSSFKLDKTINTRLFSHPSSCGPSSNVKDEPDDLLDLDDSYEDGSYSPRDKLTTGNSNI